MSHSLRFPRSPDVLSRREALDSSGTKANFQRTGVANGKPNAHKLIPKFATEWGASAMTVSPSPLNLFTLSSPSSSLFPRIPPLPAIDALRAIS